MDNKPDDIGGADLRKFKIYTWVALLIWTIIVGLSLGWNIFNTNQQTSQMVEKEARANFNKDQAFRFWATAHGGVYVPVNERTPANPFLSHIKERDIVTPSGRQLTLMNPAYMLRQIMEEYDELYGVKGRIVSTKPLNPKNAPDEWEQQALNAFEGGDKEFFSIAEIGGASYLRLMRPMIVKEGCLKCHGHQDYKIGDVRGGVGVSVAMQPYLAAQQKAINILTVSHSGIWLLGLVVIGYIRRLSQDRMLVQMQSARNLRESETRFRTLVENAADAMFLTDKEGKIKDINSRACENLGYSREELLELTIPSIDANFPADKLKDFLNSIKEGQTKTVEGKHRRKNGALFPVEIRVSRIDMGRNVLILALARDITDRKIADKKLKEYQFHLQSMVDERTAELAQARDQADAANKAKSLFLANMSHELRTPLNAVLGFSQLMGADKQLNAQQKANLEIINRSGYHLLHLINDVLDMSKIEAGKTQLDVADLDLNELILDVVDMMRLRSELKGLQLLLDETSEFPRFVRGDAAKIRQILINLLSNAIKFTNEGGVTLRLGAKKDHPGVTLRGEVQDTGRGINPEDIERIFQPFEQLINKAEQKGTGLGLTITRQFVQLMGGEVSATSKPGKGSTFYFHINVEQGDPKKIHTVGKRQARQIISLREPKQEWRILIVEDQLENRLLLQQLTEQVGFKVRIAEDGEESIQAFEEWHPHFIWMDRRMPRMDGLTAAQKIRKLPGGKEVVIAALTASAFKEQRDEVMAAGMDDFVSKPYRPEEIYDCMAHHLGLQYRYEVEVKETETKQLEPEVIPLISPAMVAALPENLQEALRIAVTILDIEQTKAVLKRIAEIDPSLANTLNQLVNNFDFMAIKRLLPVDNSLNTEESIDH